MAQRDLVKKEMKPMLAEPDEREYTLGDVRLGILSDGTFRLDGGAMFGVVPRPLWQRLAPPDEQNRIRLGLNALLVRTGKENVLIDSGIGDKWDEKYRQMYAIAHETTLIDSLARHGLWPEDIDVVINTHLHFDHCGWNTRWVGGRLVPTFPRARYVIQRGEYEHANHPHERDRASYRAENWQGLDQAGQLELIDGDREILPGIAVVKLAGHNRDFQCVFVRSRGETAVFWSDLIPMAAHVPFPWIMAFDLYPEQTLMQKKRLVPQAAREQWLCVFHHDPDIPVARIVEENGKFVVRSEN
jgi:glyoxylase-like metal-dependent hydrolase (beta-lactamase superfamily II)